MTVGDDGGPMEWMVGSWWLDEIEACCSGIVILL